MIKCWFCHGWANVAKIDTGETSWSDATGGERGERQPIFRLEPAFGVCPAEAELIECPVCRTAEPADLNGGSGKGEE